MKGFYFLHLSCLDFMTNLAMFPWNDCSHLHCNAWPFHVSLWCNQLHFCPLSHAWLCLLLAWLLIFRWKSSSLIRHSQAEVQKWSFFSDPSHFRFSFCLYTSLFLLFTTLMQLQHQWLSWGATSCRVDEVQTGWNKINTCTIFYKRAVSSCSGVLRLNAAFTAPPYIILIIYWYCEWDLHYTTLCTYNLKELFGTLVQHNINVKH